MEVGGPILGAPNLGAQIQIFIFLFFIYLREMSQ